MFESERKLKALAQPAWVAHYSGDARASVTWRSSSSGYVCHAKVDEQNDIMGIEVTVSSPLAVDGELKVVGKTPMVDEIVPGVKS